MLHVASGLEPEEQILLIIYQAIKNSASDYAHKLTAVDQEGGSRG
jgi:hypothetical protein